MPNYLDKLKTILGNVKYAFFAIVILAIAIPVLMGIFWLTQIVVVTAIGVALFIILKVFGASDEPDEEPPIKN